jgi:hypothetical protein
VRGRRRAGEEQAGVRRARDVHPEALDLHPKVRGGPEHVDLGVRLHVEPVADQERARRCHRDDAAVVHVDVAEHVLAALELQGAAVDRELAIGSRREHPDGAGSDRHGLGRTRREGIGKSAEIGAGQVGHERRLRGGNWLDCLALPRAVPRVGEERRTGGRLAEPHRGGGDDAVLLVQRDDVVALQRASAPIDPDGADRDLNGVADVDLAQAEEDVRIGRARRPHGRRLRARAPRDEKQREHRPQRGSHPFALRRPIHAFRRARVSFRQERSEWVRAAPLILLAQTRQADREKVHAEADAQHREELAQASLERQELAAKQSVDLLALMEQNTRLTKVTQELTERIKELTDEIHRRVASD